jgi:hypothetical protein
VSSVASLVVMVARAMVYRLECSVLACFYYLVATEQTMDASEDPV